MVGEAEEGICPHDSGRTCAATVMCIVHQMVKESCEMPAKENLRILSSREDRIVSSGASSEPSRAGNFHRLVIEGK